MELLEGLGLIACGCCLGVCAVVVWVVWYMSREFM